MTSLRISRSSLLRTIKSTRGLDNTSSLFISRNKSFGFVRLAFKTKLPAFGGRGKLNILPLTLPEPFRS